MRPAPLRANRARRLGAGDGVLKKRGAIPRRPCGAWRDRGENRMEAQPERLAAWLDDQIAACQARQKSLLSDDRGDEAVFEKVRTNVYDICRTLLAVAARTCEGEAAGRFFLLKTGQIRESWAAARDKAMRHEDAEKLLIENIKLDTLREIESQFSNIEERTR